MAQLRVGTSGFAYKPWKGAFYPADLPDDEMLRYYAGQFSSVEINSTYYRFPTEAMLVKWAQSVPADFQFALKANQRITHIKMLRDAEATMRSFMQIVSVLNEGARLGPILVQLPPWFRADGAVLEEFLKVRPPAFRFALEVRHASWYTDETYEILRRYQTALCLAETDDFTPPDVVTADFVYLRLRRDDKEYSDAELAAWRARFDAWVAQGLDVYAYFKHEESAKGTDYAFRVLGRTPPQLPAPAAKPAKKASAKAKAPAAAKSPRKKPAPKK